MRPEISRALAAASVAALVAGCGGGDRPLRIGVVVDCVGVFRSLQDAELSGAQLPLIARGARLRGRNPTDGITRARIAGRSIELVPGCTEVLEFSTLTQELRRLIEIEKVDAVVAGTSGPDEVVVREVARRHPGVVVVPAVHGPREVTLRRPAPNLYRVAADHGQDVAGLATHAYRELGWRRAAVVLADWDPGWGNRAAFVAEFCALGGRVTSQLTIDALDPEGKDVARVPNDVDGVAVFAAPFFGPAAFLGRLARRVGEPARRMVVGPGVTADPQLLLATASALEGVTASSHLPAASRSPALRAYLRAHAKAFPGLPASAAQGELTIGFRNAVEALLQAFERAGGRRQRLGAELGRLRTSLLGVPVRLDGHRQAVVSATLLRIGAARRASAPELTAVRTIASVDQSIGGLLAPALTPSACAKSCRRAPLPPWSR